MKSLIKWDILIAQFQIFLLIDYIPQQWLVCKLFVVWSLMYLLGMTTKSPTCSWRHSTATSGLLTSTSLLHFAARLLCVWQSPCASTVVVRCSFATTSACQPYSQTSVGGAKWLVAETVDGEVETGVQMRQHRSDEVNGQRQTVRAVIEQHQDIRAPAADKRYEDDEHRLHLTNCLHRRHITRFTRLLLYVNQNTD